MLGPLARFAPSLSSKAGLRMAFGYLFGGATLVWIATHVGPRTGTAIVHVTEPNVVVTVGGFECRVEGKPYAVFVLDLPAGEHRLTMSRGETVLCEEPFSILAGEEVVLSAHAPRAKTLKGASP